MNSRKTLLLEEEAERFDDMAVADTIQKVAKTGKQLSAKENRMLDCAFKNILDKRRYSWKEISSFEEEANGSVFYEVPREVIPPKED